MRRLLVRWLTAGLLAIAVGVAALELSTCAANEHRRRATSAVAPDGAESLLPIGAELDAPEAAALPHLTQ
jgi:hypothetical protein